MKHYPIKLGTGRRAPVKKAGRSSSAKKKGGKLAADLKQKIFERDDFTCGCCGFKSQKYQQILHKNFDLTNHNEKNLLTTCIFCHQCFNLNDIEQMKSGVLVWLPEIEQHALHNIARAIYVARISQTPMADAARKALEILTERKDEAKARLGTDNPQILAQVMQDYLSINQYGARDKKLDGIRLFPLDRRTIKESDLEFNQFPQILAYWRSKNGPFGGTPPQQWISVYHELKQATA